MIRRALVHAGGVLVVTALFGQIAPPADRGAFLLNLPLTPAVRAQAPAEESASPHGPSTETAPQAVAPGPVHVDVRGLYMTGYTAGDEERFQSLLAWMGQAGLNAVVIDAKDDDGRVSWQTEVPLAREIGAGTSKIADPRRRVSALRQRGIYAIARVVVYADPVLARSRPDLAILGGRWRDGRGIAWPDPYNREVWKYNVDVAAEAVALGFQEIQFDYVRFPEHLLAGYNLDVPPEKRTGAIEGFLRYAVERLHPLGAFVAADLFGLTTSVQPGDDMQVGQVYERIAAIVDYVLPMVYPSHYAPGTYDIAQPEAAPEEVVYASLRAALERTPGLPRRKHRPWLQDFSLRVPYGKAEVEAQVRAVHRAGLRQFLLWDPDNRYTRDVDFGLARSEPTPLQGMDGGDVRGREPSPE